MNAARRQHEPKARFRLRLAREHRALWWDHKRFVAALRRMLERAGLDPRTDGAYIAAAPMAPAGCASAYEYAELALAMPVTSSSLLARLTGALETGLRLLSLVRVPPWSPELRTALHARAYEVICPAADPTRISRFQAAPEWPWTRWKKAQPRRIDIRPAVTELACLSGRVHFALECSDSAPRPAEVIASIFGLPLAETLILPMACTGVRMVRQPLYLGLS